MQGAREMRAEVLGTGGAGAPLFYVPGIDGSGELLLGTAHRLERHFTLTRLRYEGGAAGDYARLAADVAACIEARADGRALLLAESFGVALALQTALDHPERVAGLALVNGFAHFDDRIGLAITRGFFALAPEAWVGRARAGFAQHGLLSPRHDEAALRDLLALPGNWFGAGYRERLLMIHGLDLRPRLAQLRCPVALFAADHDRVVDSVPSAREMEKWLPRARLEIIPQAGHLVLPLVDEPWEERLEALAAKAG